MSRFPELNALSRTAVVRPAVPGLIRSLAEVETNTHPLPIFVGSHDFQTFCTTCTQPVGPRRSTLQTAIADRIAHRGAHA